jgi:hypothetical protein
VFVFLAATLSPVRHSIMPNPRLSRCGGHIVSTTVSVNRPVLARCTQTARCTACGPAAYSWPIAFHVIPPVRSSIVCSTSAPFSFRWDPVLDINWARLDKAQRWPQ